MNNLVDTLFPRSWNLDKKTIPHIITFASLFSGLLGLYIFIIHEHYLLSALCLLMSCFLDFFDGKIARKLWVAWNFWAQLDTIVDAIVFWVIPYIIWVVMFDYWWGTIISGWLFLISGIYRLCRFTISIPESWVKETYSWLPITSNGILFPLLLILLPNTIFRFFSYIIMAILMSSNIRIKKI